MCQTFYPNEGSIFTNTNKSFKIAKAVQLKKKKLEDSFPFYIYFDDLRFNAKSRPPKTKSNHPENPCLKTI